MINVGDLVLVYVDERRSKIVKVVRVRLYTLIEGI